MNARIDMYSPDEVAKSVGVTSATICNWCREGLIKCNKVGDGTDKNRYEIEEGEYRYLRDLARKYGPKKVLSYYKKDKDNLESASIVFDKEYTSIEASIYLEINHDGLNSNCRAGKINCRAVKSNRKGYKAYLIPGWELVYLKDLYDKFGRKGGVGGAMSHYIKDRDKRGVKDMDMPWSLDMDQVETEETEKIVSDKITDAMINGTSGDELARVAKYTKTADEEIEDRITSKEEPSDDKLLDAFIKVRELKRDIDNMEAKLNQMKHEYAELKGEVVAWL